MQEVWRQEASEEGALGVGHGVEDAGAAGPFVGGPVGFLAGVGAVGAGCTTAAGEEGEGEAGVGF